jgi:sec-independent protein translocase protein TatA
MGCLQGPSDLAAQLTKYCQLSALGKPVGTWNPWGKGDIWKAETESAPRRGLHGGVLMLNNIGLPGLLLIAVVLLVLFGKGKVSSLMGEVGKGITAFKKGVNDGTKEIEEAKVDAAKDVTPAEKDKV